VRPGEGDYQSCHNVLKSHAAAWHTYDQQYRPSQAGTNKATFKWFGMVIDDVGKTLADNKRAMGHMLARLR